MVNKMEANKEKNQWNYIRSGSRIILVDTINTSDDGWETCMFVISESNIRGGGSEVKEHYFNEQEANRGHFKWCLKVAKSQKDYNIHKGGE